MACWPSGGKRETQRMGHGGVGRVCDGGRRRVRQQPQLGPVLRQPPRRARRPARAVAAATGKPSAAWSATPAGSTTVVQRRVVGGMNAAAAANINVSGEVLPVMAAALPAPRRSSCSVKRHRLRLPRRLHCGRSDDPLRGSGHLPSRDAGGRSPRSLHRLPDLRRPATDHRRARRRRLRHLLYRVQPLPGRGLRRAGPHPEHAGRPRSGPFRYLSDPAGAPIPTS